MAAKKKAAAKKAAPPKPRGKAELTKLARLIVHGAPALKLTEPAAVMKLQAADAKKPGQSPLDLVRGVWTDETAKKAFEIIFSAKKQPTQQTLPRKHPSGTELTTEICNLEIKIRKTKANLVDAQTKKKAAVKHLEGVDAELARLRDALEEACYDLRSGQGRISFPAKDTKAEQKPGDTKAA